MPPDHNRQPAQYSPRPSAGDDHSSGGRSLSAPAVSRQSSSTLYYSLGFLLEFQQVVLEMFVNVTRSCQSAALQFRHQPVAHFRDVTPVESCIEEQETVASDLFHDLLHHAGDVVDRSGEIDAGL